MDRIEPRQAAKRGVSTTRRISSIIVLVIAIVVLLIELRASLGQSRSAEALAAKAPDGLFPEGIPLKEGEAIIGLFPEITTIRQNENEVVRRYRWQSLLKPLLNKPESEIYLVSRPTNPELLLAFYTDRDDAEKGFYGDPAKVSIESGAMMPVGDERPADPFGIPDANPESSSSPPQK
ncbi:MAG: hypothetical protein ACK58L_06930 [Planctomycetota bacterium]